MNYDPNVRRLVQVAEEALPPMHVPLVLGNECYIVTQRDVRRIEDTREISYNKLMPNGQLVPMDRLGHDNRIRDAILNACKLRMHFDANAGTNDTQALLEYIARMCSGQMAPQQMDSASNDGQMMEQQFQPTDWPQTRATIEQQLLWGQTEQGCPPHTTFPMHITSGTSTTELTSDNRAVPGWSSCGTGAPAVMSTPTNTTRNCGTNTVPENTEPVGGEKSTGLSAQAQLKKRKEKHVQFMC